MCSVAKTKSAIPFVSISANPWLIKKDKFSESSVPSVARKSVFFAVIL